MVAVLASNPVGALNEGVNRLQKKRRPVYTKTTGVETLTAAQFIDGVVNQNAAQAGFNLTTPTAAQIVAALQSPEVGETFSFTVVNSAGGATITLVAGAGVTLKGVATVAATAASTWTVRVDNVTASSEAVTMYLS